MPTIRFLFLIVAIGLFIVAGAGVPTGRFSLTNVGLAFLTASFLAP